MWGEQPPPPQSTAPYPCPLLSQTRYPTSVPAGGHLLTWMLSLRAPSLSPKETGNWYRSSSRSLEHPSPISDVVTCVHPPEISPHSILGHTVQPQSPQQAGTGQAPEGAHGGGEMPSEVPQENHATRFT